MSRVLSKRALESPSEEHARHAASRADESSETETDQNDDPSPSKRRKTDSGSPSVSCESCKTRKVKCSRTQPSCDWCLKNHQMCVYLPRKKPGLRAGYGRELESKLSQQGQMLDQIREILQRHETAISQLQGTSITSAPSSNPESPNFLASSIQLPAYGRHETRSYPRRPIALPQSPNAPSHHAMSGQTQVSSQRNSQSDGIHRSSVAALPSSTQDARGNQVIESPTMSLPDVNQPLKNSNAEFPDYDLTFALVDVFFRHINTWIPILHRKSTIDLLFESGPLGQEEKVLLHAIIAASLRFSTDKRLAGEARSRQHKLSKEKVQLYGLEHSSVRALQALVIITIDILGDSNGPPGWNMLALIARSAVQLGLAVESTSLSVAPLYPSIYTIRSMILPEPKDFVEEESRRRLLWAIYLLDRFTTTATAFDFTLESKDVDRRLPCHDDIFNRNLPVETKWFRTSNVSENASIRPDNLGPFSYLIELLGILSKIHLFLKKPIDIGALPDVEEWQKTYLHLDTTLQNWRYCLPGEYRNISRILEPVKPRHRPFDCDLLLLHSTYSTTLIRLHSSAAYPTTRSPIFSPSYNAAMQCRTAVDNLSELSEYAKSKGLLDKLGPPFAWSIWVAARVVLVHGSTIDHRVSPVIDSLVDTLRRMGAHWMVADRYASLLQRVLDEYREATAAPGSETPSSMKILADMRRNAFDLDALISRQPPLQSSASGRQVVTPSRTPAPADLEYLDVFDFFNFPRLSGQEAGSNEFNITNFIFDVNSDWLKSAA